MKKGGEVINQSKMNSLFYLFLIALKVNFKAIIIIIYNAFGYYSTWTDEMNEKVNEGGRKWEYFKIAALNIHEAV